MTTTVIDPKSTINPDAYAATSEGIDLLRQGCAKLSAGTDEHNAYALEQAFNGLAPLANSVDHKVKRELTIHKVAEAVDEFNDPDYNVYDVASTLLDDDIKGYRGESGFCPITNFIKTRVPGTSVSTGGVLSVTANGVSMEFTLSPAVVEFVRRFDAGEFADLDAAPPKPQFSFETVDPNKVVFHSTIGS